VTGPEAAQGLVRGAHVAATLSVFGTFLFRALVAPPALAAASADAVARFDRRVGRLASASAAAALVTAAAWCWLQAETFADGDAAARIFSVVPVVLLDTHFGPLVGGRLGLLLVAVLIFALRRRIGSAVANAGVAAALAAIAVLLQVALSHGVATEGAQRVLLVGSEGLHLVAAGAWLGALLPLLLACRGFDIATAEAMARRFSPLGQVCVALLAVTSLVQGCALVGGLPGLIGTDYGLLATTKLGLFVALLGLAALNRFRLRPLLGTPRGAVARRQLQRSIATETAIGLLVVLTAGMLLSLAPAIRQQPAWPFSRAPDVAALADPTLAGWSAAALAALALGAFGIARRRHTPAGVGAVAVLLCVVLAPWNRLFVAVHPTSFYRSPTGFTAASIAHGARLYASKCATCHAARPPAGDESDGDLFWILSQGVPGPSTQAMPGLGDRLSMHDLWSIVDFLRARRDAGAVAAAGLVPPGTLAPDAPVGWNGKAVPLSRLRGHPVLLFATADREAPPAPESGAALGITALRLSPDSDGWSAYAVIAGRDGASLAHTEFLIDADGFLRAIFRPGVDGGWADQNAIAAAVVALSGASP